MKSVNNIWKISDKGGKRAQVTHHGDGNLFFPSISADGKTIVYEDNFGLWKLDTASGKSTEIRIDIKSDSKENETELVTVANEPQAFHLSPSNRRAAIVAHGEIFTIATDRGEPSASARRLERAESALVAQRQVDRLRFSDRTGREEIYISDELGKNVKKLSDADCDKSGIVWARRFQVAAVERHRSQAAPGGRRYRQDRHPRRRATPATSAARSSRPMASGFPTPSQDNLLRSHVWVKELATGQEHMIGARRVPALARRQVDARRQEAAAHRRRRRRLPWHRVEPHRDRSSTRRR